MKAGCHVKHKRTVTFVTAVSFTSALLIGCENLNLSASLPQRYSFIADEIEQCFNLYNVEDIEIKQSDLQEENNESNTKQSNLQEENNESDTNKTTEEDKFAYIIDGNNAVITGLQEKYVTLFKKIYQ